MFFIGDWRARISAMIAFIMLLTGCRAMPASTSGVSDDRLSVVATIFAPFDFAREIAGDTADITMLLPPASESHSFEPTPQDIITIQNCDVFIYVGGDSDRWAENILASMDTGAMSIVTLMDCVAVIEEEVVEGMEEEEEEEGVAYDEHVYTSPENAKLIVWKISDALCEADAENADVYREHAMRYAGLLDDLDAAFRDVVGGAARKTVVFGDRFPFRYLTDAYGLEYFAAFPGCSDETEASAATVKFLIDKIDAERIPIVFHTELGNERMTEIIAEETGAKPLLLHACHHISKDDFSAGISYVDLMTRNVQALKEALR